jgi:hypothetical protein
MPDYVTLTCPSCGGTLEITNDIDRFACAHCGAEHIVRRGGGIIALTPVLAGIEKVSSGVDRVAAELALPRLRVETVNLKVELTRLRQLRSAELERERRRQERMLEQKQQQEHHNLVWWLGFLAAPLAGGLFLVSLNMTPPQPAYTGASILAVGFGILLMKLSPPRRAEDRQLPQRPQEPQEPQEPSTIQNELKRTENTLRQKEAQLKQYQDLLGQ